MSDTFAEFAAAAPKAEIHLHLEGSVDLDGLLDLRARRGEPADEHGRRRLAALYRHRDFGDFLTHFREVCGELRSPEDFARTTTRLAERLRRDNVRHAEVMCSIGIFVRRGLPAGEIMEAVARAARRAESEGGPAIRFLFDGIRQWGPDALADLVDLASECRDHGVIGIGMGGDEASWPAREFAPVYEEARRRGLHTTVHAGEGAGPRAVWEAMDVLGVERIGHAVRAVEDPELTRGLAARRVPLECCPTSNLRTGVVSSWSAHPVPVLHRAGALVTVSTDDPAMFDTTLVGEWRVLADRAGLSPGEVSAIGRRTIEAAFLGDAERAALLAEFDAAAGAARVRA